jgi:hypothetical protein
MPLLDHFHPPLSSERRWESFHSSWLPPNYIAEEHAHIGPSIEIDVGTFERESASDTESGGTIAVMTPKVWTPPAPAVVLSSVFPETFEVRVLSTESGPKLVAAIELISPGNKDRDSERRAFAVKCASYLYQGVSLVIVDVITSRRANLHNEILEIMNDTQNARLPAEMSLYAVAYRPIRRGGKDEIDVWPSPLTIGKPLPELPLSLRADLAIPLDFEATYVEACRRKRLTAP